MRTHIILRDCDRRLKALQSVGSFLPITLEQLARERGVLLADRSKPCSPSFHITQPATLNRRLGPASNDDLGPCVVHLLGVEINTASFALYTFSLSVFVQAIVIISMSGAADHGRYRKSLLLLFAFTGAMATMLFLAVVPRVYVLGALLAIISNTCFGASFVLLNSFLPVLVRHHPSVQEPASVDSSEEDAQNEEPSSSDIRSSNESTQALLTPSQATVKPPYPASSLPERRQTTSRDGRTNGSTSGQLDKASTSPELRLSTKISSYGIGIGYTAGVLVQILAVGVIILTGSVSHSSNLAFRIVLFLIGLWWLCFTIPAALWLRPRPGPPIPLSSKGKQRRTWAGYIGVSWRSLARTILRAGKLKDVLLFLGSWFMISDSIATVSGTAILFAKTELKMRVSNVCSSEALCSVDDRIAYLACADQRGCDIVWRTGCFHLEQNLANV